MARFSPVFAAVLLLAGCTYQPGGIESPITRKFQYFSYAGGDDIRANCVAGAPAQIVSADLLVIDGIVNQAVLRRSATGEGAILSAQVFGGGGDVSSFNPLDPTGPWRGASAQTRLDERTYLDLIRAVEASGFGAPAPAGLTLPSWGFYWIVAACANGRFHYNAWLHPSERFERISFAKLLFDNDRTGVPVNPPREQNAAQYRLRSGQSYQDSSTDFDLRVGANGLVGTASIF
jgi:hypothetical protein